MSKESINLSFFDINGEYNEEVSFDQTKNFLNTESPIRIISQYITDNFLQNLHKTESADKFITNFTFSQQFKNKFLITINCDIISNFSVSHQGTFDSNGYIIFCNLEKSSTLELLEKLINYINENCSIFIKTYIVGVFIDKIDQDKSYEKMREFLKNLDFDIEFDYYEMFLGEKNKLEEIKKTYENAQNMTDVLKFLFYEIWKGKIPRINKINKNKVGYENSSEDKSKIGCKIF